MVTRTSQQDAYCRRCPNRKACMEFFRRLHEPPLAADAAAELAQDIAAPVMAKHDYRDIKIAEGMTITIDLEEIKERLKKDFYRSVGMPGLDFGA